MNEAVSNKLKLPEGVSSTGPYMDMTEAYVKAVIAIPAILAEISETLDFFALYIEKKGLSEGVLSPEDIDNGEEDGQDKTA